MSILKGIVVIIFVNGYLVAARLDNLVNNFMDKLKQDNFDLTNEGEITGYCGVNIVKKPIGTIILTQPKLINNIMKKLNMLHYNSYAPAPRFTPMKSPIA